jgi:hypothetical protein
MSKKRILLVGFARPSNPKDPKAKKPDLVEIWNSAHCDNPELSVPEGTSVVLFYSKLMDPSRSNFKRKCEGIHAYPCSSAEEMIDYISKHKLLVPGDFMRLRGAFLTRKEETRSQNDKFVGFFRLSANTVGTSSPGSKF